MTKNSISILGPGAVGGFMAALLDRAGHQVTCVARESTAELINAQGIDFRSVQFGDFISRPRAVARLTEPQDLIIVATKAVGLADALERIDPAAAAGSAVMPLLNGLEHIPLLRERFGPCVIPASISMEGKYDGPARIRHTTNFSFIRYASGDLSGAALARPAGWIEASGIRMIHAPSEADVIWTKLTRLNSLACTTAASGLPLGKVRNDPWWSGRLAEVVAESVAVARAEGFETSTGEVLGQLADLPETLGSSLQRDVEAGRPNELEAIPGAVVRTGARHGLDCPAIKDMIQRIRQRMATFAQEQ